MARAYWLSLCWITTFACGMAAATSSTNLSLWVYPGANDRLLYRRTPLGDRVLDYSDIGFRQGAEPLPSVPVREVLSPQPGDDGAAIQAALNRVASLPPDVNGFRGAVLLTAGRFDLTNTLFITNSGVVLRGAGPELTRLELHTTNRCDLLRVVGARDWSELPGASWPITDKYVPVGARSFHVAHTNGLAVGDRVIVHRPATSRWLRDIGMDVIGWLPGNEDIFYERRITRIEGDLITLDVPLANALDQRYGGGRLFKYAWPGRIRNIGIEHLEAVSGYDPTVLSTNTYSLNHGMVYCADMNHPDRFLYVDGAEEVFVQNVISRHFIDGFMQIGKRSRAITVRACRNLQPVGLLSGALRYSFDNFGQLVLVQDCFDDHGRHPFANRYTSAGPTAFVDCVASNCYTECSPRHRWTTAALYDNVFNLGQDGVHVRNWGSLDGRGYTGANCVVWNCRGAFFVVNNPPTAQNWLIGPQGIVTILPADVGTCEPGIYDSLQVHVVPRSLYHAQRQQRRTYSRHQVREYPLGDFDLLTPDGPSDQPPLADAWRAQLETRFPAIPLAGFDTENVPQLVALSFVFPLAPGEVVVGGSLDLGLKVTATDGQPWLLLDDPDQVLSLDALGWLPLQTNDARVLDLAPYLSRLADGQLHVALGPCVAVDWAVLNIETARRTAPVFTREPEADASVEDGAAANLNFGTHATLATGWSAAQRQLAYLRFDLNDLPRTLTRVRVRLTPLTVSAPTENSAMWVADYAWDERFLTWSNQPPASYHLADWIPVPGRPVEFDVTEAVHEALATSRKLCLQISATQPWASSTVTYGARENADPQLRPQLVVLSETPVVSALPSLTAPANAVVGPLSLTVEDLETPASQLVLTAWSADPTWLPPHNIGWGGAGSNRTLRLQPIAARSGSTTLWIAATDADGAATTNSCQITFTTGTNLVLSQFTCLNPLTTNQLYLCCAHLVNHATQPVPGVVLRQRLPPAVDVVSVVPSQGTCRVDDAAVVCDLGCLDAESTATVLITFVPRVPGLLTNELWVQQTTFPPDPVYHASTAVLEVDPDSDADGLPDAYELHYGLNPHSGDDRDLDADGDGLSNYQEYRAGTDPRQAHSTIKFVAVSRDRDRIGLTFTTTPGRAFQMERSSQLPPDRWAPACDLVPGTGAPVTVWLPIQPTAGFSIYRFVVLP